MIFTVCNLVFFQLLWFGSVVGAGANGMAWVALAAALPLTCLGWFGGNRLADFTTAVVALCCGLILDNIWVAADILSYPGHSYAPFWLGVLWFGLGLTMNHSLRWFRDREYLGPVVVGMFAPITYLSGEQFGAVVVEQLALTPYIIVTWMLLFFGLSKFSMWLIRSGASTDTGAGS